MKMLVAYDGTLQSKEALNFGIAKAKETGAALSVLHVFDRGMFIDYDGGLPALNAARKQSDEI
ncbi:MAG TPA: universal stress protein, partial [Nitrospirota bacterium]|nr:universal stress protein [Nitrospirota bacterium]